MGSQCPLLQIEVGICNSSPDIRISSQMKNYVVVGNGLV